MYFGFNPAYTPNKELKGAFLKLDEKLDKSSENITKNRPNSHTKNMKIEAIIQIVFAFGIIIISFLFMGSYIKNLQN